MNQRAAFRGQPLLLLAALLAGWLGMRAAWLDPPFEAEENAARIADVPDRTVRQAAGVDEPSPERSAEVSPPFEPLPMPAPLHLKRPIAVRVEPVLWSAPLVGLNPVLQAAPVPRMDVPPTLLAYLQRAQPSAGVPAAASMVDVTAPRAIASRWSADGWVLLRNDTTTPILSGRPSYGRSQAGAGR